MRSPIHRAVLAIAAAFAYEASAPARVAAELAEPKHTLLRRLPSAGRDMPLAEVVRRADRRRRSRQTHPRKRR